MFNDADYIWKDALDDIFFFGTERAPRGVKTLEVLQHKTVVNINNCILLNPVRNLSYKFMANEAYWILTGDNRVETIQEHAPSIKQFSDDGKYFFGAYGPKIIDQLPYVCKALADDRLSRQAYINIWREKPSQSKDIPCTVGLQFMIRDAELNVFSFMRSSDVWLGWPYDIFNMSMVAYVVKLLLSEIYGIEVDLGKVYLTANSFHLYEKNFEKARLICADDDFHTVPFKLNHRSVDTFLSDLKSVSNGNVELLDIFGD